MLFRNQAKYKHKLVKKVAKKKCIYDPLQTALHMSTDLYLYCTLAFLIVNPILSN